jgi:hypothetical protein
VGFHAFAAFLFFCADNFFAAFLADFLTVFLAAFLPGSFGAFFEVDFFRRGITTNGGIIGSASKTITGHRHIGKGCSPGFTGSGSIACCTASDTVVVIDGVVDLIDQLLDYVFILVVVHRALQDWNADMTLLAARR